MLKWPSGSCYVREQMNALFDSFTCLKVEICFLNIFHGYMYVYCTYNHREYFAKLCQENLFLDSSIL